MATPGYSGKQLAVKLGIKRGMSIAVVKAPRTVLSSLDPLPDGVRMTAKVGRREPPDMIIGFVTEADDLRRRFDGWVACLPADGVLWVAWPKRASKVPTDMTEHVVREVALPRGWVDVKVCAVDETWSGLKVVLRKELRPSAGGGLRL